MLSFLRVMLALEHRLVAMCSWVQIVLRLLCEWLDMLCCKKRKKIMTAVGQLAVVFILQAQFHSNQSFAPARDRQDWQCKSAIIVKCCLQGYGHCTVSGIVDALLCIYRCVWRTHVHYNCCNMHMLEQSNK